MIVVNVILTGAAQPLTLRYKASATAALGYQRLREAQDSKEMNAPCEIEDDYGVTVRFHHHQLATFSKIELEVAMEGDIEHQIFSQRAQGILASRQKTLANLMARN